MAATIPLWLLGRHFTTVTLTPCTVSTAGVLSVATVGAVSAARLKVGLSLNITPTKEQINDDASLWEHNVVLADGYSLDINILSTNDGSSPHKLYDLIVAADYIKCSLVYGTGASQRAFSIYGSRGEYTFNSQDRGKVIQSLRLDSIDTGSGADAPITVA